jgi:predicted TIM-barrel fold metal-dependent hydrolase
LIIDFGSRPPLPQFNPRNAAHLAHYDVVYATSADAAQEAVPGVDDPGALDKYLRAYDDARVEYVVIHAKDVETTFGIKISNEDVAAFCREHGKRFIGFAGVDPHKGYAAIKELQHAVEVLGMRGLNLQCFEHKMPMNDARYYPLYAKCIELDIPVGLHASINFSTKTLMECGRPLALDEVMVHFPELRVVAIPPGFPWVQELIGVAWRHRNVMIGLTPVRPKYLTVPDSGYGPLVTYGNGLLKDRMIFGTSYPLQPILRTVAETEALPLKPEVKKMWFYDNAARLLGLPPRPPGA